MARLSLPVVAVSQNSRTFFVGKMRADEIKNFTAVDHYKSTLPADHPNQGYQRPAEPIRYKQFANYLIKEEYPFCPTALLLSAREEKNLGYDPGSSTIQLDSSRKLQIVDGQHRAEGYRYAIFEKKVDSLQDFEVPVIIISEITKITEMQQFNIINGKQKGVRRDLVNMILTHTAAKAEKTEVTDSELARIVITRAVEILNNDDKSPWKNLIVMPDEKVPSKQELIENPVLLNQKIVRATSFMTSIKPVYDYLAAHDFIDGDVKVQAQKIAIVLMEFWAAIKELMPDAFETPSDYVLQKTPGLFSLHSICRKQMVNLYKVNCAWDRVNFKRVLSRSEALIDASYWSKIDGDAAKYGSMKGFSELAREIESDLAS